MPPTGKQLKRAAHQGRPVSPLRKLMVHATLLAVCVFFLAPFVWMISTSLKPKDQLMSASPTLGAHAVGDADR